MKTVLLVNVMLLSVGLAALPGAQAEPELECWEGPIPKPPTPMVVACAWYAYETAKGAGPGSWSMWCVDTTFRGGTLQEVTIACAQHIVNKL
ncbi:MAG: hypothetical protein ACPGQL_02530 [Thermoplasmatota archaeon]